METSTPPSSPPRVPFCTIPWLLILFTSLIIFGNHYARDSVGALQLQMENDIATFSSEKYATMNSLFFVPSIFAPLLGGIFSERLGGAPRVLFYAVFMASVGHVIFAFGVQYSMINLIFIGRFFAGFMYEIIDMTPIVIIFPLFAASQGFVIGIINGALRLGSVANFFISPIVYETAGVTAALWV